MCFSAGGETQNVIELTEVSKAYDGKSVLRHVNWTVAAGEQWQITGASGIGKTTLLRLVTGLEKPDSGSIRVSDGLRFAPVFQDDVLIESYSALENVALVCGGAPDEDPLCRLLPANALTQPVCTLSGGMRRRVALARALAAEADVLVLDEPFAGLDAENIRNALDVLEAYRRGRTLLLVSHGTEALLPTMQVLRLA